MDEEKATRILAKELGDKLGREFIFEEVHKEHLIKTSEACYQVAKPWLRGIDDYELQYHHSKGNQNLINRLIANHSQLKDANYFFMTNTSIKKETRGDFFFAITPYALIGETEKQNIKKLCYKDVPPRILSAMDVFSIDNYIDAYQSYINLDCNHPCWINNCIAEFLNLVPNITYDSDGETNKRKFEDIGGIEALNSELEKIGIKARISTKAHRSKLERISNSDYISKKNIQELMSEINQKHNWDDIKAIMSTSSNEFYNFSFDLPSEDQNIGINKQLLRLYPHKLDYLDIMEKEYVQGRHFQKYFDCLGNEEQEASVRYLADTKKRNLDYDSFLWSKGFKEVSLDYMDLYQNNADGFIKYFDCRKPNDKKIILRCIMNCDFANHDIDNWLHKHELDLLREVSMK